MTIGVVGAGTMGSLIAALGCVAGEDTLLHDPDPDALERGAARARDELAGGAARGRWAEGLEARLTGVGELAALAPCAVIVEAAPERLAVKQELFRALAAIAPGAVLATNTSSIPVTAIAAALDAPEHVVGLHFFNPATRMALVELVAGAASGEAALARARALGEAMGKRVVAVSDGPGFLVNRCARPFGLEALRLLQERVADVGTIDRVVRLGGGFRMGPFELQDLVGIDVGLEVSRSFHELSFGEPRWRPSPLSARQVAAGWLGRKSGRGWYRYEGDGPHRPDDPPPPPLGAGAADAPVAVTGTGPLPDALRALAAAAGWHAAGEGEPAWLVLDCGGRAPAGPRAVLCARGPLAALDPGGEAVGFHAFAVDGRVGLVELTRPVAERSVAAERAERLFASLGAHTAWVGDAPGLVLGRVVAQLVNEALFALEEEVARPADLDDAMVLGLNHPRGPLAWLDAVGPAHLLAVLDALRVERGEAYRAAPALRRLAGG